LAEKRVAEGRSAKKRLAEKRLAGFVLHASLPLLDPAVLVMGSAFGLAFWKRVSCAHCIQLTVS
jgi:hypothetical protein